jgi:hypothetical protein
MHSAIRSYKRCSNSPLFSDKKLGVMNPRTRNLCIVAIAIAAIVGVGLSFPGRAAGGGRGTVRFQTSAATGESVTSRGVTVSHRSTTSNTAP